MTESEAIEFLESKNYRVIKRRPTQIRPKSHNEFLFLSTAAANALLSSKINTRQKLVELLEQKGSDGLREINGIGFGSIERIMTWWYSSKK